MRKYSDNMKCAFVHVLMNLIYGEGLVHNSFPSKSIFKSVIRLRYHPDVTTPLLIPIEQQRSSRSLSSWAALKHVWKFSPSDYQRNYHRIGENICVIMKSGYINRFHGQSLTPVLSLEHLIPVSHTALLQFIHGAPSFPPAALISGGRGARILHSVRVGIWIGLSLLEQSLAAWSCLPPPNPHLVMTRTSCQLEEEWAEWLGVLCTVTFPPVMMFRYHAAHYCFLCRKLRGRMARPCSSKFSTCFKLHCCHRIAVNEDPICC